jgi:predicted ATP-binding protein involved in virulence
MTEIAESLRALHTYSPDRPVELPLVLFYRTNRAVFEVPQRIRQPHLFSTAEAYDEAVSTDMWQGFRLFFEWFREREDLENESRLRDPQFRDKQLQSVRTALSRILPEFASPHIERAPQRFLIEKRTKAGAELLEIGQLSDGEKILFVLAADIARRLAIANPQSADPLNCYGIILVDEIELHLHPGWQRRIVESLLATFPNCQFLLTTHSPQVVSGSPRNSLRILSDGQAHRFALARGRDTNSLLEAIFSTPERPPEFKDHIARIGALLDSGDFATARTQLEALSQELSSLDPDVVRLQTLLHFGDPADETHSKRS